MPALNAATARDMITLALKEAGVLGVGQTALAEDMDDCFTLLQRMTNQWQRRRWMVPSLTDISKLGNGAVSNTVGPGGYWNITPRPRQIKAGYFIINTSSGNAQVSLPLSPVFSYEDYARITVKNLATFPENFFYDNQNNAGLGNLFIWPIPDNTYTIHIIVESDLGWPNTLNSVFTMPEEYAEAVHYNLAMRICSAYQIEPQASTSGLAKVSLNTIKVANTQIPELQMPPGLRKGKAFSLWKPGRLLMYNFIGDNLNIPITNMFDINGDETNDPLDVCTIVALLPNNEWLACECQPHEIIKRVTN